MIKYVVKTYHIKNSRITKQQQKIQEIHELLLSQPAKIEKPHQDSGPTQKLSLSHKKSTGFMFFVILDTYIHITLQKLHHH